MALSQDSPAPEYVIRNCALQLTKALYNVHSAGVIVRNLHPHKVPISLITLCFTNGTWNVGQKGHVDKGTKFKYKLLL